PVERSHLSRVGDVEVHRADTSRAKLGQRAPIAGLAHAGDHVPARRRQAHGGPAADAPAGSGDEHAWHNANPIQVGTARGQAYEGSSRGTRAGGCSTIISAA